MNLKKLPQSSRKFSSCEIRFGVSGLNNPSLIENFFPEDLPEDWHLSYYSNEFHLLLISLLDLNIPFSSQQEIKAIVPDEIIEALVQFSDELEEDFLLLFDVSTLSDKTQHVLYDVQKEAGNNCHFINLNNMDEEMQTACSIKLECISLSSGKNVEKGEDSLLCTVDDKQENEQEIAAIELRKLIEQVRAYAILKEYNSVNILFTSAHNALENCRNAILLESMM